MRQPRLLLVLFLILCLVVYHAIKTPPGSQNSLPASEPMFDIHPYFHEIDVHYNSKLVGAISHIDSRFGVGSKPLAVDELQAILVKLFKSYTKTMEDLAAETWLAHGTLLGHYWGRRMLPWDTDIDVQMSMSTLETLAMTYNSTQYEHDGSKYIIDVNPNYSLVSTADVSNKIDARWIDMETGKYIDITALHQNKSNSQLLFCKDRHQFASDEIYPLQSSIFEGVQVKVPNQAEHILSEEYGPHSLVKTNHHWHKWDSKLQRWVPEVSWWTNLWTGG